MNLALLRIASLLVPAAYRAEWLAEWKAELWYVGPRRAKAFCAGAFKDAFWLMRNNPRGMFRLESPSLCLSFLAIVAVASASLAYFSVRSREIIVPSPYPDAQSLVLISRQAATPSIEIDQYQSWRHNGQHLFTDLAFYWPVPDRVQVAGRQLSIARASSNLFDLLEIPVPHGSTPAAVLSRRAFGQFFGGDRGLAARVLGMPVAAVVETDTWTLPGSVDAWLLEDERRLPSHADGFVLARVKKSAAHPQDARWRMAVPNESGGYDYFQCESLGRPVQRPFAGFLAVVLLAGVLLPATTSLSLGDYPAKRGSVRRWIFLGAKIALVLVILYCGIRCAGWEMQGLMAPAILAFRWVLNDQRERCPECLRLLANPVRVGRPSYCFLGWNGTELMCERGHGLLHVPEPKTSWSGTQRWCYLDPSWNGLF